MEEVDRRTEHHMKQNPTRSDAKMTCCVLQTGRTNGYIGLAFSYSDLPIGATVNIAFTYFYVQSVTNI